MSVDRSRILTELTAIVRDIFDDPGIQLTDATTAPEIEGWDSLNHINIVVAAEKKFGVKFKTAEVARFQNVGQFVDSIVSKLTA